MPCLLEQRLDGVLRRAALTVGEHLLALEVVERLDGGIGGHHVEHAQVVNGNNLIVVLELVVVEEDGPDVAGQGADVVVPLVELGREAHVVHAVQLEGEVVEGLVVLSRQQELRESHGGRAHDEAHAHLGGVGRALELAILALRLEGHACGRRAGSSGTGAGRRAARAAGEAQASQNREGRTAKRQKATARKIGGDIHGCVSQYV